MGRLWVLCSPRPHLVLHVLDALLWLREGRPPDQALHEERLAQVELLGLVQQLRQALLAAHLPLQASDLLAAFVAVAPRWADAATLLAAARQRKGEGSP